MPTLQASNIADLLHANFATPRKGRTAWNDLAATQTECIALPQIMRQQKAKFSEGSSYEWKLLTTYGNNARTVGLYANSNVNAQDVLATASIPWRHALVEYGFDDHEKVMNSGPEKIVDMIDARDAAAMGDLNEKMETWFWGVPSSSTDTLSWYGVKYWLVWNATTGFSGGSGISGVTNVAGVDPATGANSAGWKNYTDTYTDVSKTDAIKKLRKAFYKTGWKSTVPGADPKNQNFKIYTVYDNVSEMEQMLEAQNDNLGNDVASKDGMVKIRGFDVIPVSKLDETCATSRPFYGIDWNVFFTAIMSGFFLKRIIKTSGTQSAVTNVHIHLSGNFGCLSRRRLFVVAKSDPALS